MTIANEVTPSKSEQLKLRPRPQLGLGAALIGKEEEELVLQVVRNQEPFRYYGHDGSKPPMMAANLEKEFAEKYGFKYTLAVTSGTAALECEPPRRPCAFRFTRGLAHAQPATGEPGRSWGRPDF